MRRLIPIIVLILLSGATAQASLGMYCTTADDWYYHQDQNCQGENRGYYMEQEQLERQEKFPCPVCVPEKNAPDRIMAATRGGTIVLCMPDEWMKTRTDIMGVFGLALPDRYTGEEAEKMLAQYLHGLDYTGFRNDYHANGRAEARVFSPSILMTTDYTRLTSEPFLNMHQRHIGGAWYIAFRPEKSFEDELEIYLRFFTGDIKMENDELIISMPMEWGDSDYNLKLKNIGSNSIVFSKEYEDIRISVFRERGVNIAAIYEYGADETLLEGVRLNIAGAPEEIMLSGYISGETAVFCCVLTDGEVHALEKGAEVYLRRESR